MSHSEDNDKSLPAETGADDASAAQRPDGDGVSSDATPAGSSAGSPASSPAVGQCQIDATESASAASPAGSPVGSSTSASRIASTSYLEDITAGEEDADEWAEDDSPSGGILPADFWGHVEDLRAVIMKSVGAFLVGIVLVMLFSVRAQKLLTWPLEYGLRLSGSENTDILLRTDGPFSVFTFMLQLWVFGGLLLALPFMLYFAASFIAPGLTAREKKLLRPVAFAGLGLFLVGCLFAFFLLLPTYIAVSLSLENVFGFASLWTPTNYYGAVVWTTLGMGLVFEFPLVLVLLQSIGLLSADTLRNYRRHAFVFILIFAALLTPGGDPISLAVCSLPLYALFELSIIVGERLRKRATESDSEADYED